jgi:hypothetical protein
MALEYQAATCRILSSFSCFWLQHMFSEVSWLTADREAWICWKTCLADQPLVPYWWLRRNTKAVSAFASPLRRCSAGLCAVLAHQKTHRTHLLGSGDLCLPSDSSRTLGTLGPLPIVLEGIEPKTVFCAHAGSLSSLKVLHAGCVSKLIFSLRPGPRFAFSCSGGGKPESAY